MRMLLKQHFKEIQKMEIKCFKPKAIISKLRQVEVLCNQSKSMLDIMVFWGVGGNL